MPISRRSFLGAAPAALALAGGTAQPRAEQAGKRLKIAVVTTVYYKYSHSEHIVDRFLEGYGWDGRHHHPNMDIVSLYVDQVGRNDLSRERARRHRQMKIVPFIEDALTLGGSQLAVDGVLLIGEHGDYPVNEKKQVLYPRYEFFKQIVDVYKASGKTAPIFNDKHLSWKWEWAKEMVDTSRSMGFGLMAGSSLPVAWRQPEIEVPRGAEVEEAVAVYGGGIDGGDIHAIEAMQSLVERRGRGETGVKSVQALRWSEVWHAFEAGTWDAGGFDRSLFEACLSRSNQLNPAKPGFNHVLPTFDQLQAMVQNPIAYRYEYNDGLKVTMLAMPELIGDWTVAVRVKGGETLSTCIYLPYDTLRNFFNPQVHHIESLFLTGKAPYPVERTLLTTGLTAAGVESLYQRGKRLETPHLGINYQPTKESTYRRS